jgi:nitroreductase
VPTTAKFSNLLNSCYPQIVVNEGIGTGFVGVFEDDKIARILELLEYVKPVGIIALGYPDESPAKMERIEN